MERAHRPLLTKSTAAVHDRCITRAALDGFRQHAGLGGTRMAWPNWALVEKNPAYCYGKPKQTRGFLWLFTGGTTMAGGRGEPCGLSTGQSRRRCRSNARMRLAFADRRRG